MPLHPVEERSHFGPLTETSTRIQRTMVVGLGGTGSEIIRRLKRRLAGREPFASRIRFLSLDTDIRAWLANVQFPALEPRERVPLYYNNPENVLESPHLYPTVQHLWQQGRRIDISLLAGGTGAGLMPVLGRVAFHLNATQICAAMQRALRDLQAIPSQPGGQPLTEEYRIYVVGSVAGGTGAGCFVETAVLLRHVMRSLTYSMVGLLALPEAFAPTLRGQQLDVQSRGNAYAVLKELQYLQDGPAHWEDPETYTFQLLLGGQVRSITLATKPFDILYVIDNQNQEGRSLRELTDIYAMAAQQLAVEIGSPLGAKFAAAQANDRAVMGLAPCPETGRPANLSTLATAALVIPTEPLLRYVTRRYLAESIREHLLGGAGAPGEAERQAAAWLLAAHLQERGAERQISQALLTDPTVGRELSGAEWSLDVGGAAGRTRADSLTALRAQEELFETEGLALARALVERNLKRLMAELPGQVSAMLEQAFTRGGLLAAAALREAVSRELAALCADLLRRVQEEEGIRADLRERLEAARAELENRSGLLGALFGRRRELIRLIGRLHEDLCQNELEMIARRAALKLAEAARAELDERRRSLEALQVHLSRLGKAVEAELAHGNWNRESGRLFALETEVIPPDRYGEYYRRLRPSSAEPFMAAAAEGPALASLAGLSYGQLASRLGRAAREQFEEQVFQLNVVEVIAEQYSRAEAFALLDDLARRCQPFWTASPRGATGFSDVFLIGSPGMRSGEGSGPVSAEPLLQEWVDQHAGAAGGLQSSPTYVALGAPGAIIFSRQTHGARLHYMRQIPEYQEHYRALLQQRGYPVHFKPVLEALPELRPDDERATEAWALSVAYGMVAAKSYGWVWALDTEEQKEPENGRYRSSRLLCTGSLWDLAAEIAPVRSREMAAHSTRFLHATRSGAAGQFGQRRVWVQEAEQMVVRRLETAGKHLVSAELARYLDEVISPRLQQEEAEVAALTREQVAIRRFLGRINL